MRVKIDKQKIPILFLDTFFFINLAASRHSKTKRPYFSDQLELIDLIHRLTKQQKILCPQGDQDEEYELGKYEDEIRKEQAQLSYGISVSYHYGVKKFQTRQAMMAYLNKDSEVVYNDKSLFLRDPAKELEEALRRPFIITAHLPMPKPYIEKKKKTKKELAEEFEKLRKEKVKLNVKYADAVKQETLGTFQAIKNTFDTAAVKVVLNQPLTEEESNGMQILGELLSYYSHYSKKEATPEEVMEFLKSDYYAKTPYISIQSQLFASLLTQSGKVKESDNFDFYQVSQMLPFSTYFLTDASLKHRLTTSPLELDKKYKVKILSIREIKSLIRELSKL